MKEIYHAVVPNNQTFFALWYYSAIIKSKSADLRLWIVTVFRRSVIVFKNGLHVTAKTVLLRWVASVEVLMVA
jgi:hypothetical protein